MRFGNCDDELTASVGVASLFIWHQAVQVTTSKMASQSRICPFCSAIFDQAEIKDHIGMTHFKSILLGKENQHVKEALLTSLGLNPLVLSEKLTLKDLQI